MSGRKTDGAITLETREALLERTLRHAVSVIDFARQELDHCEPKFPGDIADAVARLDREANRFRKILKQGATHAA